MIESILLIKLNVDMTLPAPEPSRKREAGGANNVIPSRKILTFQPCHRSVSLIAAQDGSRFAKSWELLQCRLSPSSVLVLVQETG